MTLFRILLAAFLSTLISAQAQSTLFRCVDDKGVTHYGETMPAACAKKDVTEMSKQGRTIRKLDAPLTPEQQKAKAEADAKQRENDKKVSEQRQKDLALLGTFGAEREIDVVRDKDVAQLEQRRTQLQARITDADMRLKKVNNQMEFYISGKSQTAKAKDVKDGKASNESKNAPLQLQADLDRAKADRANITAELARLEAEKKEVIARHEVEKDRLRRLKGGMRPGTILDERGNVLIEAPMPRGGGR